MDSSGFLLKLNSEGDFGWARNFGFQGFGLSTDVSGNVYTVGIFRGSSDFDPGEGVVNLSSKGEVDVFICRLNSGGELNWATSVGGSSNLGGHGIAVDGSGGVYVIGSFVDSADFDPGEGATTLTSAGRRDIFTFKLRQSWPRRLRLWLTRLLMKGR